MRMLTRPVLLAVLAVLTFCSCGSNNGRTRTHFSFSPENDVIALEGMWAFTYGDNPGWALPDYPDSDWSLIKVHGLWVDQGVPGTGIGWYRTWIEITSKGEEDAEGAVAVRGALVAAEIYWDGQKLGNIGIVGRSEESETFTMTRFIHAIPAHRMQPGRHLLAVRVSNHHIFTGGIDTPPEFGLYASLSLRHQIRKAFFGFLLGVYFLTCIYMIVLFLGDKQHREYLLFALLAFSGSLFTLSAELLQSFRIDQRYYVFLHRIAPSLLMAIPFFLFLFLIEQFDYRNRWLNRTFVGLSLVVISIAFLPMNEIVLLYRIQTIWTQLQFLTCVAIIAWAVWKKKPAGRLFVAGVLTAIGGALYSFRVDEAIWGFAGFAVFMFVMAFGLSRTMAANQREIRNTRDIFRLFVPEPVLDRIAKQGIQSIRLGGAEESTATIVFADIKAFASIAEKLSPNQTLQFLNSFIRTMQPLIHANGGFINQFVGDEIMAIFHQPGHVDAGIETAIAMRRALEPYNLERGGRNESSIDIGIGINTGGIIWGTIGSEVRMESALIGDPVNLASRLQSLTRHYGVLILASEHVVQQLSSPDRLGYREVDIVQVKGRNRTVAVYEFFDADPEPAKAQKKRMLGYFMEGIVRFRANYWSEAQALFSECVRICPTDHVSQMYVDRCKSLQRSPPQTDWNGITVHLKK